MNFHKNICMALCLSAFFTEAGHAVFVGPPSGAAGVVERQIEQEYQAEEISPEKSLPLLEVDIPEKTLDIPAGRPVFIQKILIEGNLSLKESQLAPLLVPYTNRDLTGQDVRELCLAIQNYYAQQGYILARVFPPVQDIHDQTLTIRVMEGILNDVQVVGNHHYGSRYIKKHFKAYLGKPVNYNQLLRALLLLNENTDLNVGAVFKKGDKLGCVDLNLVVKDKRPVHLYADYNNYGSSVTTLHRSGARFDYGNLLTSGDKLSLIGVIGFPPKHLYFTNAIYSVPLNGQGTRMEVSYLYSHFDVQRLESLDLEGRSQVGGIRFNQALARTRRLSTDIFVGFDIKQLQNFVLDSTDSYDKLRVLNLGGKVDYIDTLKGRNIFDAYVSIGIPDIFGGLKAVDSQCSREGGGGRFYILNLDYKRVQQLPLDCFLLLNASAQGSFNKLPIPQQIYIGGIDTVRGFPLAVALGDNGYYGNLELRVPPPFLAHKKFPFMKKKEWKDVFQFVGFIDHGGVYTNDKVPSESSPVYLTSAGAGVRFFGPWNIDVSFDAGFPLSHPKRSSDCILYFKVSMRVF